jgi:hypothetical protein
MTEVGHASRIRIVSHAPPRSRPSCLGVVGGDCPLAETALTRTVIYGINRSKSGCSLSESGALGHHRQALFEVAAGLIDVSPGDAGHRHGSGDDHIGEFGEQVVTAAADPLA